MAGRKRLSENEKARRKTDKLFTLPLYQPDDRDIIEKLDSIGSNKKSDWVRKAIRNYMHQEESSQSVPATAKLNMVTSAAKEEQHKLGKIIEDE